MKKIWSFTKKHPKKLVILGVVAMAYYFCLPNPLFKKPYATVIEGSQQELLGAKIAGDGQWRFPPIDSIPYKYKVSLLQYEDAHFYKHPGFNPVSIWKALQANAKAGKVVRGGSTITQQVIRLSRGKKRSYWEKFWELILATRLELRDSKEAILRHYASHAPFGGNVVGLEMAAWRYFGVSPNQLSWAEAATLAVLPNAPSLIYPGKNQEKLLVKRNALLKKLQQKAIIDSTTYELALLEALPKKPKLLPKMAPHLVEYLARNGREKRIRTTLNVGLQENVNAIVNRHYEQLKHNQVHNAAVLVMRVATREVIAYVGNTPTTVEHQKDVDMIQANRSTGSTLKPFLYAAMLDSGELLPEMLVADVPTQIAGYTPENFSENYSGAVSAKRALSRSLNIPAVRLLQSFGLEKFRDQIDFFNLRGINKNADHYGLTLILGGAETNLWDLCKTYAGMASTVTHFNTTSSEYYTNEFTDPVLLKDVSANFGKKNMEKTVFGAASIYLTLEAMKEVNRPEGGELWEFFDSSKEIAWKTGTSFGNKDAWAIGTTTDYVVGVWVGNADGEGRPNITGLNSAAPILFDVFDILPRSKWFSAPLDAFKETAICRESGYLPSPHCPVKRIRIPNKQTGVKVCVYHQPILLDNNQQFRVNASCEALSNTESEAWFVLPPLMAFYYQKTNPNYKSLPPFRADCILPELPSMEFIYPKDGNKISLTKNFEGTLNEVVVKLAHSAPKTKVFWYLDETFLDQTTQFHEIGILPSPGIHKITALDELGNEKAVTITIE